MINNNSMKLTILLSALFLCEPLHAGLEGDYKLLSGSNECPRGGLQTLVVDKQTGERIFIFGSRPSWPMNMKDASETKEIVDGGCTYVWTYEKSEKSFLVKTNRSMCPVKADNGVVVEKILLKDNDLSYEFNFNKKNIKCLYKKVVKP
jgi:hypothetical protein